MNSRFERFHPIVSFLFYAGAISLVIFMLHPVFLVGGLLIIITLNYIHDRLQGIKRWLIFLVVTFLVMIVLNPFFNERGRHLLFEFHQHRFTLEAVTYGGINALSIISVILLFISYNTVMTPNKLLFLFAKFLPQFAILLMLTLRFIPLMRRRLEEIAVVQQSKGLTMYQGTWKTKVKTGMMYVQTLLTYSLEEAIQTADSMAARGYGQTNRSTYEYFNFHKKDLSALLFLLAVYAVIIFYRIKGFGYLTIYPVMESWGLSIKDILTFLMYLVFLCFPIIIEAGGKFRWR